jgi:hypothetical protein
MLMQNFIISQFFWVVCRCQFNTPANSPRNKILHSEHSESFRSQFFIIPLVCSFRYFSKILHSCILSRKTQEFLTCSTTFLWILAIDLQSIIYKLSHAERFRTDVCYTSTFDTDKFSGSLNHAQIFRQPLLTPQTERSLSHWAASLASACTSQSTWSFSVIKTKHSDKS